MLIAAISLVGCAGRSAGQPTGGQAQPLVHFPADQSQHPAAHNEWWYVVGHMRQGARSFGYELTIFKLEDIRPPGFNTPISLYRTDIAVTDEAKHRFLHRVTYYFPGSAHLSTTGLDESVGQASLTGPSAQQMHLRAAFPGAALDLHLSSRRAPMYVGGRGYISLGNGYSYYYSLTDLRSGGTIRVGNATFHTTGVSWLDHQWGRWAWTSIRGWTWMALQLNNGVQLSVADFRGTHSRVRLASVLLKNGRLLTLPNLAIRSTGTWRSPHSGAVYPSGWVVTIPRLHAVLHVSPTVKDQEMTVPGQLPISYWEGSGHIAGTFKGKAVTGLSYTELTGYAGPV